MRDASFDGVRPRFPILALATRDLAIFWPDCGWFSAWAQVFLSQIVVVGYVFRARGSRLVTGSVWDPGRQNDPNSVTEDKRVKVLYQGDQFFLVTGGETKNVTKLRSLMERPKGNQKPPELPDF